jgi:hypothetical protein
MQGRAVALAALGVLSGCGQQAPVKGAASPASTKQVATAQAIESNPCIDSGQSAEFCSCVTRVQAALVDDVEDGATLDAGTQKSLAECAALTKPEDAAVGAEIEPDSQRQRDLVK